MHIRSNISDQFTLKLMAQSQLEEANHQWDLGNLHQIPALQAHGCWQPLHINLYRGSPRDPSVSSQFLCDKSEYWIDTRPRAYEDLHALQNSISYFDSYWSSNSWL